MDGNAFTAARTRLASEATARRFADPGRARAWHAVNPGVRSRFGQPVAYVLYPQVQPLLLADESSSIRRRAAFATNHLWVHMGHRGHQRARS